MTMDFQNRAYLDITMDDWWTSGTAQLLNRGTLGGTVQLGDGATANTFPAQAFPHGMTFDGANDYLTVPAPAASYSFGNGVTDSPFSVEMLVLGNAFCMYKGTSGATSEWSLRTNGTSIYFTMFTSEVIYISRRTVVSSLASVGPIYHVVGVYDGSAVNTGIQVYTMGLAGTMIDASAGVYVATNARGGPLQVNGILGVGYFANTTHNVAVYPFALTPSEVAQTYRRRLGLLQRGF